MQLWHNSITADISAMVKVDCQGRGTRAKKKISPPRIKSCLSYQAFTHLTEQGMAIIFLKKYSSLFPVKVDFCLAIHLV